jgi:hypothetical protein
LYFFIPAVFASNMDADRWLTYIYVFVKESITPHHQKIRIYTSHDVERQKARTQSDYDQNRARREGPCLPQTNHSPGTESWPFSSPRFIAASKCPTAPTLAASPPPQLPHNRLWSIAGDTTADPEPLPFSLDAQLRPATELAPPPVARAFNTLPAGCYQFPGPADDVGPMRALAEDPFHLDWPHW